MGRFIASDQVRSDAEIKAVIEGDATLDLDAASTIDGVQIASTDDVRTDAEIVAAVEASATLDLDAGATIDGSGIVSDSDLAAVELDDLADVSVASPSDQDVLTWDDGTSTWVAQAAGGGVSGDVANSIEITRTTATSTGDESICIGNDGYTLGQRNIAIGKNAEASSNYTLCLGYNTEAKNNFQIAIGAAAGKKVLGSNDGTQSIFIGSDARMVLGVAGQSNGKEGVCFGYQTELDFRAYRAVAIGAAAQPYARGEIAIGYAARADRQESAHIRPSEAARSGKNATVNSYRFRDLHHVVEMRTSTDASTTSREATANGSTTIVTTDTYDRNVVVLADGKVVGFHLRMTAIQGTTNDAASYEITGAAKCISGTASIIGATTTTAYEDDASWDCTVTCTSNRLVVTCTADAGGTATWRGILTLTYDG